MKNTKQQTCTNHHIKDTMNAVQIYLIMHKIKLKLIGLSRQSIKPKANSRNCQNYHKNLIGLSL